MPRALPGKEDFRARVRPPMALPEAESLGKLGRDLAWPRWTSVACCSPSLAWAGKMEAKTSLGGGDSASPSAWLGAGKTEAKNSLEGGNSASASTSSRARVRGSPVGCSEPSGLVGGALVLLTTSSAALRTEARVDLGRGPGPSSKTSRVGVAKTIGTSEFKEGGASVATKAGSSVAKGRGACVPTVGGAVVAPEPETSGAEKTGLSVAREGV